MQFSILFSGLSLDPSGCIELRPNKAKRGIHEMCFQPFFYNALRRMRSCHHAVLCRGVRKPAKSPGPNGF
jgi:hypothetical protein